MLHRQRFHCVHFPHGTTRVSYISNSLLNLDPIFQTSLLIFPEVLFVGCQSAVIAYNLSDLIGTAKTVELFLQIS